MNNKGEAVTAILFIAAIWGAILAKGMHDVLK